MSIQFKKSISIFALIAVTYTAILALLCPMMLSGAFLGKVAASPCGNHQAYADSLIPWNAAPVSACMSFHQNAAENFIGIVSGFTDLFLLALVVVLVFYIFSFRRKDIYSLKSSVHLRQRWKQFHIYFCLYFEKQFRQWIVFTGGSLIASS